MGPAPRAVERDRSPRVRRGKTHRVFELFPREAGEHLRTTEQAASGAAKADHHAGSGAPGPATPLHTDFCEGTL